MEIKIGTKIRELRQRDGRKQEDLANALGVTCQAVSRWEKNSGYPDMELIPAIANYFHITIDELFGYSKDREEKLKAILSKTDRAIGENGDMEECVKILRAAAEEFPSEAKIFMNLGFALCLLGWQKYGAKSYTTEYSDYAFEDIEYNSKNAYWEEEIKAYEKALALGLSSEERDIVVTRLVIAYAKMGYSDKAKSLADNQNSVFVCREVLLPQATGAEERDKYYGEAVIALLQQLKNIFVNSVFTNRTLITQPIGKRLLFDLINMYESVFSDGRCGVGHYHLSELYLHVVICEAIYENEIDSAMEHFDKGFEHYKIYKSIRHQGIYQYTAPMVSKVTFPSENFPGLSENFWAGWISVFPEELVERIKSEPKYAECFE